MRRDAALDERTQLMTKDQGCVVIGAGLAAANVVQTLRDEGFHESITLIGDEFERPYERPPLSKGYLQGMTSADELFVHDEHWYADHEVGTRFGDRAVSIDPRGRRVTLASGVAVPYQDLVWTACGPCVRVRTVMRSARHSPKALASC
jgi:3-phenylpropionate/trans-cinnamate dioxygenase ferredoxin reductase subunit